MMLCIPKIVDFLKILTNDEMKDFIAIKFYECFKSAREKLNSKLREEQNISNIIISFCLMKQKYVHIMPPNSSDNCVHHYNIKIFNLADPELQLVNIKPVI